MQTIVLHVLLLIAVNALPFLADMALGKRYRQPVDGGRCWRDGRRLFGTHKTWRGIVVAVAGGAALGPLLSAGWWQGAVVGLLAMTGDLTSSFIKRRHHDQEGTPRLGLDQLFEALLPALFLVWETALGWGQAAAAVVLFIPVAYQGSRFLHYVLYRPSPDNYPRLISHPTRFREWRARHHPMARWQRWLNFENYGFYRGVVQPVFLLSGLYRRGIANTLSMRLERKEFTFDDLPEQFDGWTILYICDLHLDGIDGLAEAMIRRIEGIEVDLCIFGGDLRMEMYGSMAPAFRELRMLLEAVNSRNGVYGVLGNHDCIEMLPEFEAAGIRMLVNDARELTSEGEGLWLVGVDDPHFYRTHDLEKAFRAVPEQAFRIFVAHSPEAYREAAAYKPHLYLCGHTHGGQICLPGLGPVFTHSRAPRRLARGQWTHDGMLGYTSRGAGASGVPLRFNCPGEITLITLRRGAPSNPITPH